MSFFVCYWSVLLLLYRLLCQHWRISAQFWVSKPEWWKIYTRDSTENTLRLLLPGRNQVWETAHSANVGCWLNNDKQHRRARSVAMLLWFRVVGVARGCRYVRSVLAREGNDMGPATHARYSAVLWPRENIPTYELGWTFLFCLLTYVSVWVYAVRRPELTYTEKPDIHIANVESLFFLCAYLPDVCCYLEIRRGKNRLGLCAERVSVSCTTGKTQMNEQKKGNSRAKRTMERTRTAEHASILGDMIHFWLLSTSRTCVPECIVG